MANLTETPSWPAGIYQIETTDPVVGGPDGISNVQAKQLANRTVWLKLRADELEAARGGKTNLAARLAGYDAFEPSQQTGILAAAMAAMALGGVNAREIDVLRRRHQAQGVITIKNKFVLAGFVLTKSDIRALHLSRTGTLGTGVSQARIDGITVSMSDDDYALSVPTNETAVAKTYHAYLRKIGAAYGLEIGDTVPDDALPLYTLTVPGLDAANNLAAVALTDQRLVQADTGWTRSHTPFAAVALAAILPSAGYAVALEVESATNVAAVGNLVVYDKATNGFKVRMTGSADNVRVRWTVLNPNYA